MTSAAVQSSRNTADVAVKGVEPQAFIAQLSRAARLSTQEETRIQQFLALISRSQGKVDRVMDDTRRGELKRRLDYQAAYGIKLRAAPEKREALEAILKQGIPRLVARSGPEAARETH